MQGSKHLLYPMCLPLATQLSGIGASQSATPSASASSTAEQSGELAAANAPEERSAPEADVTDEMHAPAAPQNSVPSLAPAQVLFDSSRDASHAGGRPVQGELGAADPFIQTGSPRSSPTEPGADLQAQASTVAAPDLTATQPSDADAADAVEVACAADGSEHARASAAAVLDAERSANAHNVADAAAQVEHGVAQQDTHTVHEAAACSDDAGDMGAGADDSAAIVSAESSADAMANSPHLAPVATKPSGTAGEQIGSSVDTSTAGSTPSSATKGKQKSKKKGKKGKR